MKRRIRYGNTPVPKGGRLADVNVGHQKRLSGGPIRCTLGSQFENLAGNLYRNRPGHDDLPEPWSGNSGI